MQINKRSFHTTLLALCPLVLSVSDFWDSLFLGGIVFGIWLATFLIFKWTRSFFPKRFFHLAIVLWLAVWAQVLLDLGSFNPIWITSVVLMMVPEMRREQSFRTTWHEIFWQGGNLWIGLVFLGSLQWFLGMNFFEKEFQQPAGSFLLLGIAAFIMQKKSCR
ncbi:MAG: hypothetical protein PHN49_01565 [Candidatus Omnitrophica bacterium]|nr:hypothetical protein [Candidatus Omnitrophota bacterium]MDD5670306.1 hypothetical protein [Candidatus Omnitrophota bacterium]